MKEPQGVWVREAIEEAGGRRCSTFRSATPSSTRSKKPPQSSTPLLLKAFVCSVNAPWNKIGASLDQFTPQGFVKFFFLAGYEPL